MASATSLHLARCQAGCNPLGCCTSPPSEPVNHTRQSVARQFRRLWLRPGRAHRPAVSSCPAPPAAVVEGIDVIGVNYLTEAVGFLTDELLLEPVTVDLEAVFSVASKYDIDFSDVRGQETAKRALTISAAGAHNPGAPGIGPPGSGKTVSARTSFACDQSLLRYGTDSGTGGCRPSGVASSLKLFGNLNKLDLSPPVAKPERGGERPPRPPGLRRHARSRASAGQLWPSLCR